MPTYTKDEFVSIVAAYVLSGSLKEFKELNEKIEHELKQRFMTMSQQDIAFLLRIYASCD